MKKKFPINLISDAMMKYYQVGKPECCPIEGSGIQLEWDNKNRHLEIEIPEYFFLTSDKEKIISGEIKSDSKELVDKLFKWLNFERDQI